MDITDSSLLTFADFENGTLTVRFRSNGSQYNYYGVPLAVWNDFQNASSKGSYFSHYIKGKYESERV